MTSKSNPTALAVYLHDHLGAANSAVALLEKWRDKTDDKAFRHFAGSLLAAIKADRMELRRMVQAVGGSRRSLKELAGWLAEKATRLKLGTTGDAGLALFEGLEILSLGIAGKHDLWTMLAVVARSDRRLRRFNFRRLIQQALTQRKQVERLRLKTGKALFATRPSDK